MQLYCSSCLWLCYQCYLSVQWYRYGLTKILRVLGTDKSRAIELHVKNDRSSPLKTATVWYSGSQTFCSQEDHGPSQYKCIAWKLFFLMLYNISWSYIVLVRNRSLTEHIGSVVLSLSWHWGLLGVPGRTTAQIHTHRPDHILPSIHSVDIKQSRPHLNNTQLQSLKNNGLFSRYVYYANNTVKNLLIHIISREKNRCPSPGPMKSSPPCVFRHTHTHKFTRLYSVCGKHILSSEWGCRSQPFYTGSFD